MHSWAKFVALHISEETPHAMHEGSTPFSVSERCPEVAEVAEVAGLL